MKLTSVFVRSRALLWQFRPCDARIASARPGSPTPPKPTTAGLPRLGKPVAIAFLVVPLLLLCQHQTAAQGFSAEQDAPPPLNAPTLVHAINTFAIDTYRELSTRQPRSFTFSPPSLWLATGSLAIGAQGETARELQAALRLPSWEPMETELPNLLAALGRDKQALAIATRLFVQQRSAIRLLPGYLHRLEQSFKASAVPVDFAGPRAARTIDAFLADNGFQQPLAASVVNPDTRLLVANVVCAKAVWTPPFPRDATRPLVFHGTRGDAPVPFLHDTRYCGYAKTSDAHILQIPGGHLALVIILPEGRSLPEMERQLDWPGLEKQLRQIRTRQVHVRMPRFSIQTARLDGRQVLETLGAVRVFRDGADLSAMTGDRSLRIEGLIQCASLTVNEEGAEATAATLGEVVSVSRSEPLVVQADRPFLACLVYRDTVNNVPLLLFMGRYDGP